VDDFALVLKNQDVDSGAVLFVDGIKHAYNMQPTRRTIQARTGITTQLENKGNRAVPIQMGDQRESSKGKSNWKNSGEPFYGIQRMKPWGIPPRN
jgi:hypothetical protein